MKNKFYKTKFVRVNGLESVFQISWCDKPAIEALLPDQQTNFDTTASDKGDISPERMGKCDKENSKNKILRKNIQLLSSRGFSV